MRKRALIFYISQFSGHFHAASAIEKGLLEISPEGIDIEKINAFSYTNPILERIINRTYLEVIKKKPEFWGRIYDNPDVIRKTKKAREVLHRFNTSKIQKLIEEKKAEIVLCTQAFPCGMVADYKRSSGSSLLLIGVLTDHAPHSYWLFDEVDYYIVPSKETQNTLIRKGISPNKIKIYGIPVDPLFRYRHDIGELKARLGLKAELFTILVMGGSQGLGAMEDVVLSILNDPTHNYQLLVVAGTNKKLYKRMKKLADARRTIPTRFSIFGYIKNIDELMEVSDIIVTKAGGMTIAEALVKRLPLLIVDPIPGHERMNTDYLVEKGAALEIIDYRMIARTINELVDTKEILYKMRRSAEMLAKPNSALDIAKLALS